MAQTFSHWAFTVESQVQSQDSPCGICVGQSDRGTGFNPCSVVSPCHHHSADTLLIHIFHFCSIFLQLTVTFNHTVFGSCFHLKA